VCGTNYECTYDYYVTGDEDLGQLSANFSDQFNVITNITAAGKYILNVDVCHMVIVVYLLRAPFFVTRHNSSDTLSLHLTLSVLL
jgi:hypothetical protein